MSSKSGESGFTLIEVALAVLAIGLGLTAIFALFPAGLQNAADDVADTRAGFFAAGLFAGIRGEAARVTDAATWDAGLNVSVTNMTGFNKPIMMDGSINDVKFPPDAIDVPESHIRCRIGVSSVPPSLVGGRPLYAVSLFVCNGQYGFFTTQNVFYTELYYSGN